jgi:hypothetical protein
MLLVKATKGEISFFKYTLFLRTYVVCSLSFLQK